MVTNWSGIRSRSMSYSSTPPITSAASAGMQFRSRWAILAGAGDDHRAPAGDGTVGTAYSTAFDGQPVFGNILLDTAGCVQVTVRVEAPDGGARPPRTAGVSPPRPVGSDLP
jgi:hypothetical protein